MKVSMKIDFFVLNDSLKITYEGYQTLKIQ